MKQYDHINIHSQLVMSYLLVFEKEIERAPLI
jgi:hypothetical protein